MWSNKRGMNKKDFFSYLLPSVEDIIKPDIAVTFFKCLMGDDTDWCRHRRDGTGCLFTLFHISPRWKLERTAENVTSLISLFFFCTTTVRCVEGFELCGNTGRGVVAVCVSAAKIGLWASDKTAAFDGVWPIPLLGGAQAALPPSHLCSGLYWSWLNLVTEQRWLPDDNDDRCDGSYWAT